MLAKREGNHLFKEERIQRSQSSSERSSTQADSGLVSTGDARVDTPAEGGRPWGTGFIKQYVTTGREARCVGRGDNRGTRYNMAVGSDLDTCP